MDSEETRLYYILWPTLVLVAVLTGNFVRLMHRSRYRKDKESELDTYINNADEHRTATAAILHNDIQPYITTAIRKIELMQMDPQRAVTLGPETMHLLEAALGHVRDITKMIMPDSIAGNDLINSILKFTSTLHQDKLNLIIDHNSLPLLKQKYLGAICRVMQEIIYNTIKHSGANMLRIDAFYENNLLTIKTAEQGWKKEFHPKKSRHPGVGRTLMDSRIRLLKGTIYVNFSKQNGMGYVLLIPVPPNQIDTP